MMNILKNIKISGEVFSDYAFLSYVLSFKSNSDVSAEYIFSLPDGALISAFKIYLKGKALACKVISAAHASTLLNGEEAFAILKKVNANEYVMTLGSVDDGGCDVLMSVYVPMKTSRLILPLTKKAYGGASRHKASIRLRIADGVDAVSSTHNIIVKRNLDNTLEAVVEDVPAICDFCLDISRKIYNNSAAVVESVTGGEMICNICIADLKYVNPQKILFIYDTDCGFTKGEEQLAKSFIYYAAKAFDGSFAVANMNGFVTPGFVEQNDENTDMLLDKLGNIYQEEVYTESIQSDNEVLSVCVTNSCGEKSNDGINYVSVGKIKAISDWHIYPKDNLAEKSEAAVKYFAKKAAIKNIKVTAGVSDGEILNISENGYVSTYISYTGKMPETIELTYEARKIIEKIDNINVYKSYAPISLAYAESRIKKLEKKLVRSVGDAMDIREQIEAIGVKYHLLNSETALAVPMNKKSAIIKVVIPSATDKLFEADVVEASFFRENQSIVPDSIFVKKCIAFILGSLRSDGAICADGETDCKARRLQTEICLAALIISRAQIDINVLDRINLFLQRKAIVDKKDAELLLESVFKMAEYIPENIKPDLLTAARAVWQGRSLL